MKIGSRRQARLALTGELKEVGCGAQRKVYRCGSVVYKVEYGDIYKDCNTVEHENARRARRMGYRWAPPTTLYDFDGKVVLAMPYYSGPWIDYGNPVHARQAERVQQQAYELDCGADFRGDNARFTRNGRLMFIDIAVFGRR